MMKKQKEDKRKRNKFIGKKKNVRLGKKITLNNRNEFFFISNPKKKQFQKKMREGGKKKKYLTLNLFSKLHQGAHDAIEFFIAQSSFESIFQRFSIIVFVQSQNFVMLSSSWIILWRPEFSLILLILFFLLFFFFFFFFIFILLLLLLFSLCLLFFF